MKKRHQKKVKKYLSKNPYKSAKRLKKKIGKIIGESVSASTVNRYSLIVGLEFGYEPTSSINFTKKERKERVKWAKEHIGIDWTKYVFLDEFSCYRFHNKKKKRHDPKSKRKSIAKYNPNVKCMVGFSAKGRLPVLFYKKRLNTLVWLENLEGKIIPSTQVLYPGGRGGKATYFFDRDPSHKSKASVDRYEELNLKWELNGPKYADMNPIENLIAICKQKTMARNPQGVKDLKKFIIQEWEKIPEQILKNCIESMPKRIELCIKEKGKMTKYGRSY